MDTSYVIPPVDKNLIKEELGKLPLFRKTNYGGREIYITTAHQSPNIMREIGRLREISFGASGGGSGTECDIDQYDVAPEPHCYKQLFVYDPVDEEIVGGYRFIVGKDVFMQANGELLSATADLFFFSDEFKQNLWPYTMELGRSFVRPEYQPTFSLRKGMYSLDNLWDGLGGLAQAMSGEVKYFFGKITMYPSMNVKARDYILYFYRKHFPDNEGLVWPREEVQITTDYNELVKIFNGKNYKEDYQNLLHSVRQEGETVPPLVNAYMNLSSTMKSFGTSINKHFSCVEETGILVTIADIYEEKRQRYMTAGNHLHGILLTH
ncbi:MAG: GNAT family N-acetyltransferase [Bacteroidales bacterium]|nr:GNAT family N-acetyltransferase [Bacteroidales bacterium]